MWVGENLRQILVLLGKRIVYGLIDYCWEGVVKGGIEKWIKGYGMVGESS